MLVATNPMIITTLKDNEGDKYKELINNSIKIDFGRLHNSSEMKGKITFCQTKSCGAVFHDTDLPQMLTLEEYEQNMDKFGSDATISRSELQQANRSVSRVWCCKYCGRFQLCKGNLDSKFLPIKFLLDEEEKKSSGEPIILFIIDSSASMETPVLKKNSSSQVSKQLLELIEGSELVRKSQAQQRKAMQKLRKSYGEKIPAESNYITKRHFMLGLITKVLRLIKGTVKSNKQDQRRKIGFIFFNDKISLVADGLQPDFPIIQSNLSEGFDINNSLPKKPAKQRFRSVNYHQFDDMFKLGQQYGELYNTCIVDLNQEKMDFSDVITEGQTALGPAIAVALGITSKHGHGSSIVVVTDGFANLGILQAQSVYREAEDCIVQQLRSQQCLMSVLSWKQSKESESKLAQQKMKNFNSFVDRNNEIISRYEVTLNIEEETINTITNALSELGLRKIIGVIRQCRILCSADFIKFEKTKFEESMLNDGDLLTSNKSFWLNIKLDKAKITEDSYNDPVYTQCIIKYQDVNTKKTICVISEVTQKLCKQVKKMINLINFDNIQQYFDKEDIKNFSERNTIRAVERTIRDGMNTYSESMRSRKMNVSDIRGYNEAIYRSFNSVSRDREYN